MQTIKQHLSVIVLLALLAFGFWLLYDASRALGTSPSFIDTWQVIPARASDLLAPYVAQDAPTPQAEYPTPQYTIPAPGNWTFPSCPCVTAYPNPGDWYYVNLTGPCNTQVPCGAGIPTWTPQP